MAKIVWKGDEVRAKVAAAAAVGIDATMDACVDHAKENHPAYPPASEPYERYANRTAAETGSIRILDNANGIAGAMIDGASVHGEWGATMNYSLFLEIGTSVTGPTATERMEAGAYEGPFDPTLEAGWPGVAGPEGPLMAPRPFLRPAADEEYPLLAARIGASYRGERIP